MNVEQETAPEADASATVPPIHRRWLDAGLAGASVEDRLASQRARIFALLAFVLPELFVPINLGVGLSTSAQIQFLTGLGGLALLIGELRRPSTATRRTRVHAVLALVTTSITVTALIEDPLVSPTYFFNALPVLGASLVLGQSGILLWAAIAVTETVFAFGLEMLLGTAGDAASAIGACTSVVGFLMGICAIGAALHRPVDRAFREVSAYATALAEKQAQTERALRARTTFLANMSHELRTPMNAVIGITDLLWRSPLTPDQRDLVSTIRRSGEGLVTVLNDILDFAKMESGQIELQHTALAPREVIGTALDLLAERAFAKGLELCAVVDRSVPDAVLGDPTRLHQIVVNLVGNAIKFTHAGEIVVRADAAPGDGDRVVLRVRVSDTGIGIDDQSAARLFRPFVQVDAATSRRYGGTGLGLAISRSLVEHMGGSIGVESQPGSGSTFWFEVPSPLATIERAPEEAAARPWAGREVLVIARSRSLCDSVAAEIESLGGSMESVADLADARAYLVARGANAALPALVLLDTGASVERRAADASSEDLAQLRSLLGCHVPLALLVPMGSAIGSDGLVLPKPVRCQRLRRLLDRDPAAATDGPERESPAAQSPDARTAPTRVLLVEDDETNQLVLNAMLETLDLQVEMVADGYAALARLAASPFDLVFMDVHMPGLDGFETVRRLRGEDGPNRRVHVVALTANALVGDREACLAAGMNDYLTKPVRLEELAAAIARLPR